MQALYKVKDGLVSFGPELFEVFHLLEGRFAKLATSLGATPMTLPALIRVEDLSQIDYFENFPHLGTWVGPIKHACLESYTEGSRIEEVSSDDLVNSRFGLPSAACYGVYIDLRDAALAESRVVTITERCFETRNTIATWSACGAFTCGRSSVWAAKLTFKAFCTVARTRCGT